MAEILLKYSETSVSVKVCTEEEWFRMEIEIGISEVIRLN
jgi:hypothetical protein